MVSTAMICSGCRPTKSNPSDPAQAATATPAPSPPDQAPDAAVTASDVAGSATQADAKPASDQKTVSPVQTDGATLPAVEPTKVAAASDNAAENTASEKPAMAMSPASAATWSAERIVIMGKGGPRFLKLNVNVGNEDLEIGFRSALSKIAEELQINFKEPIAWKELLDKPLIASGWLGNLVPDAEQREQLRGLYDKNDNGQVDESEFQAFLTRGLSRMSHLKLSSRASTAPQLPSNSVWGPIDQDENGELSAVELAQASKTMLRFDFDGDNTLTAGELRTASDSDMNMSSPARTSMLDLRPVHQWDSQKPDSMVRAVFDHYSFGEALTSEMLSAWPALRWKHLDANADSSIAPQELRKANDEDLDGSFQISLPDYSHIKSEKLKVNFQSIDPSTQRGWIGHPTGGRLTLDGCIVTIVINDEQDDDVRQRLTSQFGRIEKDAQLQAMAMQVLELKPGAIELLTKSAQDQQVEAAELAWRWLVTARHRHLQIGWSASESPWFELMDLNGDQKVALAELDQFASQALKWDVDKDGAIQTEEMPISVLMEFKRGEVRGLRSRLGGVANEKRGANVGSAPTWFTGMDYNSDGEVNLTEFLGDQADFGQIRSGPKWYYRGKGGYYTPVARKTYTRLRAISGRTSGFKLGCRPFPGCSPQAMSQVITRRRRPTESSS